MAPYNKQVKINERKRVTICAYNGKTWLHIRDEPRSKTLSFTKDDFTDLLEKLSKIEMKVKECERSIKQKPKKSKKSTKSSESETDYADQESD